MSSAVSGERRTARIALDGLGIGITGGGGHLGSALALGLADAGALVVIAGRTQSALDAVVAQARDRKTAGRVFAQRADVRRDAELGRVLDRIEDEAGAVHGWINNAYFGGAEPFLGMSREGTETTLAGGVGDLMLVTQAVARRMLAHRAGSIVNVASMYGRVSPQPAAYASFPEYHNPPAYGAAKAGVIQFTRYVACHLAPQGVRVNSLSPGPFPRDEIRAEQDFTRELAQRVPLGRVAEASELVGPAAFLLSDASSFVTGHDLAVDGGWTAW